MRRADIEVPNLPVDVDSWGRSACYPRGSFYPLSDGPPTRYHRITKPDFRPCSTYQSRSQAPLYLCAQSPIADRAEGTFGLLRYALGGDRPSQTAHLARSPARVHGTGLELKHNKAGVSSSTRGIPGYPFQSLPATLRMLGLSPILSCSKGSRGLSV